MSSALQLPRERVLTLDPATVEACLVAHGWELDPQTSSSEAGVYHLPSYPAAEVLVPRDKGFADYALRVGEVLQALAVAERRTAWELLEEVARKQAGTLVNGPGSGKRGRGNGATGGRGK